jgi:hypothetical protein
MTVTHAQRQKSRGVPASVFTPRWVAGVQLLPLAAYLDSTHLAPVAWYRTDVFGPGRRVPLPRGCFLEDTLGQAQLAEVRAGGPAAHARYATFLAHEGAAQQPVVCHLDGHDGYAARADWSKWRHAAAHTSEEEWQRLEAEGAVRYDAPRYTLVADYHDTAAERLLHAAAAAAEDEAEDGASGAGTGADAA